MPLLTPRLTIVFSRKRANLKQILLLLDSLVGADFDKFGVLGLVLTGHKHDQSDGRLGPGRGTALRLYPWIHRG
jgi:hypothetical protein